MNWKNHEVARAGQYLNTLYLNTVFKYIYCIYTLYLNTFFNLYLITVFKYFWTIKTHRYHSISLCKANQKWARVPSIKKHLITCIIKLVVTSDYVFFTLSYFEAYISLFEWTKSLTIFRLHKYFSEWYLEIDLIFLWPRNEECWGFCQIHPVLCHIRYLMHYFIR